VALAFTVAALARADGVRDVLGWAMVPSGALLAAYTALLFGQCEGRDLWQSRLLLPHTLVNAVVAGAGALGIATLFGAEGAGTLRWALVAGGAASVALIALDTWGSHATEQAERAARNLRRDRFARRFLAGLAGLLAGALLPLAGGDPALLAAAGALALIGLWLYEDAWVRAGQSVPLS
jgi:formate-dependent nitrite reductase membrane component NrfD